jgi:lysyl-tRNA synthetase class 1
MVFAVGTERQFEPLRAWFTAIYEVCLGQSQGPRFGGFVALYGVKESAKLIRESLARG